jgi:hypothetical protein
MLVEISISSTETTSPDSSIAIKELNIANLAEPIRITIPLYSELNTSNPNNTLACGFIDTQDQIFKQTGMGEERIKNNLVTCLAYHLTTIAVEQYAQDVKSTTQTEKEKQSTSTANELN